MTDWKRIAEAQNLNMEDAALELAASRLAGVEQQLAALLGTLSPDDDPATMFDAAGTGQ